MTLNACANAFLFANNTFEFPSTGGNTTDAFDWFEKYRICKMNLKNQRFILSTIIFVLPPAPKLRTLHVPIDRLLSV